MRFRQACGERWRRGEVPGFRCRFADVSGHAGQGLRTLRMRLAAAERPVLVSSARKADASEVAVHAPEQAPLVRRWQSRAVLSAVSSGRSRPPRYRLRYLPVSAAALTVTDRGLMPRFHERRNAR